MKIFLLLGALAALSLTYAQEPAAEAAPNEPTVDERAVHAAIEDYVLAFYRAEPERLERSMSPAMKKMGYWRSSPDEAYSDALHMTYEQACELAGSWNAEGQQGEDLEYAIELYEVCDKTACGKVTAKWGQDYFQLAKEEGGWRIHHVLWQSAPPQ